MKNRLLPLAKSANVDTDETPSHTVSVSRTTLDTIQDGRGTRRSTKHGIIVLSGSKVLYANTAAHEYIDISTGRVRNPTLAMAINGLANGIMQRLLDQSDETQHRPLEAQGTITMQDTQLILRAFGIHNRSRAEEPRIIIVLETIDQ